MSSDECVAVGWRFNADPITFALGFFYGGPFRQPANHAEILTGTAAQIQLLGNDSLVGVKEGSVHPDRRIVGKGDLGPARRLVGLRMFERDLFKHLHVIAALEMGDNFTVDGSLPAHVGVLLRDDCGSWRQRPGLGASR